MEQTGPDSPLHGIIPGRGEVATRSSMKRAWTFEDLGMKLMAASRSE
jgi:hypothetical protein